MRLRNIPALILARGGSKGIPGKNLRTFAGRPLLAWTILQARAADEVGKVYVSSDSDEILDVARDYGAVAITRPAEIATDTSTSEAGWLHLVDVIIREDGTEPELVVALQATSPLREPSDIDGAIRKLRAEKADSLFSDAVLDDLCAWSDASGELKGQTFDPSNRGRRQDRKPLYLENGSIYVLKPSLLRNTGNRLGGKIARFTMDYWKSFEIDTQENAELCEFYFRRHLLPYWESRERAEPAGRPELLVYDFDGVMTDNRVLVLEDGTEGVVASRADGWGVAQLKSAGFRQVILSTETNPVVASRARKLGIEIIQGCGDKASELAAFCGGAGLSLDRVLYVGNDVNDLEAMQLVGMPVAPSDAHASVKAVAKHVTSARGGEGVIKELSELLLAQHVVNKL